MIRASLAAMPQRQGWIAAKLAVFGAVALVGAVLLARLLALAPRILVLDEPTRGIDVGSKVEIQKLISDLAATGISVVFISAELEEVLRVSHRIIVLRDRRIVATLSPSDLTIEGLLAVVAKAEGDE